MDVTGSELHPVIGTGMNGGGDLISKGFGEGM
jgi:hypothetical protein